MAGAIVTDAAAGEGAMKVFCYGGCGKRLLSMSKFRRCSHASCNLPLCDECAYCQECARER